MHFKLPSSSINANIRSLVKHGQYMEALQLYSKTQISDKFTFPSLLKASSYLPNQNLGKKTHASIITLGLQSDPYISTSLINMYTKYGSLSDASLVFDKISQSQNLVQDVTLWNSIIDGYFRYGCTDDGFVLFRRMQLSGVKPDAYTISILLRSCSSLVQGKQIHGYLLRHMFYHDPFLDTALIDMYLKYGRYMEASLVFDKLEDKSNTVTWNTIISGFYRNGMWMKSLEYFLVMKREGCKLESATFSSVLTASSERDNMVFGQVVHCDVIKSGFEKDAYVSTSLLTLYSKYRLLEDAERVFHQVVDKEIELWNAMISAYVGNDYVYDALNIYDRMRLAGSEPDSFTLSNILSVCGTISLHDFGRMVHGELMKRPLQNDTSIQSSLLTMYARLGIIEDANLVFTAAREKDVVTWGSMISGFSQNRKYGEALSLFKEMRTDGAKSDSKIMVSIVGACAGIEDVSLGFGIHGYIIKNGMGSDVFMGSALIDMYAKFGLPEIAGNVFSGMTEKNLVAWNSLISGYNKNNLPELSIDFFCQILQHGLNPDSVSITNILVAISSLAALHKGKAIHGFLVRLKIQTDLQVENSLIDMYIKCGCLKNAQLIFENMPERNIITWNSIISGYGSHGDCRNALKLFDEMQQTGMLPDEVTFLALISSCGHSGLTAEGLSLFQTMKQDYGIEPRMEHYVNIVSLLGRAGRLDEAYRFIREMPMEADKSVWLCLLSGCRIHGNIELGELAAGELLKLEPTRGSNYIQLLNLYGEGEMWEKAAKIRMSMKERGIKKNPGCSWIEIKDRVNVFFSGDSSSPSTLEIYDTLWNLRRNMIREEN